MSSASIPQSDEQHEPSDPLLAADFAVEAAGSVADVVAEGVGWVASVAGLFSNLN